MTRRVTEPMADGPPDEPPTRTELGPTLSARDLDEIGEFSGGG
ncbi:hypothetical protein [Parafrankia sp. FMc2]